jgi:hypothetical protein
MRILSRWRAYLEGYMMAFDLYPESLEDLYIKDDNEAFAADVEALRGDLDRAVEKLRRELSTRGDSARS